MIKLKVVFALLKIVVLFAALNIAAVEIQRVQAFPSSNHIFVSYRTQERGYYCGPAAVQMALSYLTTEVPSQDQLATEMHTDPVEGVTYTDMMHVPFLNRGFPRTYESTLSLDELKEHNAKGYPTIILIYFDTVHEIQHYVLVVGYNASGIFVHDPWPVSWGQPEGRHGGENAFISGELLSDLWNCDPSNWGLVIPYSGESNLLVGLWQQYWYIFLLVPAAITGIIVAIYVRRKKAAVKDLSSTDF